MYLDTDSHPVQKRQNGQRQWPTINQTPPSSMTPASWTAAYQRAKDAGRIPNVPPSSNGQYPPGTDPNFAQSWTWTKAFGPDDIYEAPANEMGVSFDDGPTANSPTLYSFLQQHNQTSTSFMIGSQIIANQDAFHQAASNDLVHLALHTWSHHLLTEMTDEMIVAEFGWNMQAVLDLSGKLPAFYRPPQGDVDARVRAIAKEVFGLTCVLWDYDSDDWCIQADGSSACPGENPGGSADSVKAYIQQTLHKSDRSSGIIMLEHELTQFSVGNFIEYFPQLAGLGWRPMAIPDLSNVDKDWYANAADGDDTPRSQTDVLPIPQSTTTQSSTTSASSSAPTSAATVTASGSTTTRSTATVVTTTSVPRESSSSPNGAWGVAPSSTLLLCALVVLSFSL
ncbi:glycoside hydrolase/deacetylase [Ceraceosorus guamensis]|uniref:chitin deacetylase n=1 Tax=Ceraceosorus guamensis TaxID=1522189 RepID=A0A316W404_9BASI|nr:glycoside hydrolase/deacetylase [Ceraceosorus guamensis]PWN44636.1 glycoside hydrolase/deacetylase [Ceraceosorus guamensis]